MFLNRIFNIDVLDGLTTLEDNSVDLIITSPPYNKAGFNGKKKKSRSCLWEHTINYGGDVSKDCIDEELYEQWQVDILNECYRVLKDNGSMFYNHKVRVRKNQISHPIEWISKCKFNCRQIITWDRTASPNPDPCRYVPTTELIFWLCKNDRNPRFKRDGNAMFQTEVWRLPAEKKTEHPAPFPVEIPDNIIPSVAMGGRITVLDPFMGSGTTAVSALKNNCDYIGFEILPEYVQMAENNIQKYRQHGQRNT